MNCNYLYVIGSINTDICVVVDKFPESGETVSGRSFSTTFGGKGANQAVALGRLCAGTGKKVQLAGKIGKDFYGKTYRTHLEAEGITTRYISESGMPTGTAVIEIDLKGTNKIVVIPGANADMDSDWWNELGIETQNTTDTVFLFQLEILIPVVCEAMKAVHAKHALVILDPAPAGDLPDDIWTSIDYITPNQTETQKFTGIYPANDEEARNAANIFLEKGVGTVIIKAGGTGSWLFNSREALFCPAFPVTVVDTTAAGDSFNAGFAYSLGSGDSHQNALLYANAVGGLSITSAGAQDAMPDRNTVEALLKAYPKIFPRSL